MNRTNSANHTQHSADHQERSQHQRDEHEEQRAGRELESVEARLVALLKATIGQGNKIANA